MELEGELGWTGKSGRGEGWWGLVVAWWGDKDREEPADFPETLDKSSTFVFFVSSVEAISTLRTAGPSVWGHA